MAHSFLPPSGAAAWSRCALWPTMNRRYPQTDSPETIEGSAAHWVAWEMRKRTVKEGEPTPYGVFVTDEMLQGAELLWDAVEARIGAAPVVIESTVTIPTVSADCFGTPDLWAFDRTKGQLSIFDYKFGHRFVDEFWNRQGLLYLFGILELIGQEVSGEIENVVVTFTIVQPRCFYKGEPVRRHVFTVKEALEYVKLFIDAARAAHEEEPTSVTGEHCCDCPGRHACPTLQLVAYSGAEMSTSSLPHDLTPVAAAIELRFLERALGRLQARVDGLSELTLNNLKAGKQIPLYHLELTKPRQQWTQEVGQVIAMGELLGKDLAKPAVVTPLQAKKMGIDEAVISAYSVVPPGSQKLAADNPTDVRKVFSNGSLKES